MTEDGIALKQLLDKASDAELLAEMIAAYVGNRLLQLDIESLCRAAVRAS